MNYQYDYIIAGAGAAGLSLVWKLLQSPLTDKKILVVDADLEPKYDKTWCFWDSQTPDFSDIIYRSWSRVEVNTFGKRLVRPLRDFPYYCIRSIDFKEKLLSAIRRHPNVELLERPILELTSTAEKAFLKTETQSFEAKWIFQSCFSPRQLKESPPHYPLQQHFLGWEIACNEAVFDESVFTLMDFDDSFSNGVAFIYLLPWTPESALVEYTVFSRQPAPKEFYQQKISVYLNNRFGIKPVDYSIQRTEFGSIPMEDRPEAPWFKPRILNVGTSGSLTKPTTGYTYKRIQAHTDALVEEMLENGSPQGASLTPKRFKAYDLWFLQIMHDHPEEALRVFQYLLQNNSMDEIFRFLGEKSSALQDLKIMSSVPSFPFLRAIWKTRKRLFEI